MGTINRNNLITRLLTGAGFVIVILGSVILNYLLFSSIFFLITVLTIYEYQRIHGNASLPHFLPALFASVVIYLSTALVWFGLIPPMLLLLNFLIFPIILIPPLYSKAKNPIRDIALTVFGLFYIVIPLSAMNLLFVEKNADFKPDLAIGFFITIWTYDSFAYLTGVTFGRHRLFKRISPKKSWEGTAGGFVFGLVAAWVLSMLFPLFSIEQWIVLATIIMVFGTFGDLLESLLKRNLNIKDSGNILPGHGGLLDRFDAVLLAAPVVVVYAHLILLK